MVDPFWKQPTSEHERQLATIKSAPSSGNCVCVPLKPMSTMEERSAAIMSRYQIVAELASTSNSATSLLIAELDNLIDRLSMNQNEKINGKLSKIIEKEANNILAKEYISNPPVQQKQSQVRKQPSAIGAPTTSSYKAAGARSPRERKQSMKLKESKALGRS